MPLINSSPQEILKLISTNKITDKNILKKTLITSYLRTLNLKFNANGIFTLLNDGIIDIKTYHKLAYNIENHLM